jgi:hypothetical protein
VKFLQLLPRRQRSSIEWAMLTFGDDAVALVDGNIDLAVRCLMIMMTPDGSAQYCDVSLSCIMALEKWGML